MRRVLSMGALALLVAGSVTVARAGGGPSWSVSPTQGPSPNTIDVAGTGCVLDPGAGGPVSLAAFVPGIAHVEFFAQDGTTELTSQDYTADASGNWGGPFAVPGGRAAGPYPMKAHCNPAPSEEQGVALGQTNGPPSFFQYEPDRSYTVIEEKKDSVKAEAVEAEVTLTG
ncbi:MAG TPA: hypothetical protein VGB28_01230 [Actinomycetota bacterium]